MKMTYPMKPHVKKIDQLKVRKPRAVSPADLDEWQRLLSSANARSRSLAPVSYVRLATEEDYLRAA